MFSLARLCKSICTPRSSPIIARLSNFHLLANRGLQNSPKTELLGSKTPTLVPTCGFKAVGFVRRRCKDCYFVKRQDRLYVICKTHGRHKQMITIKKPENTWILSHATQGKVRPW